MKRFQCVLAAALTLGATASFAAFSDMDVDGDGLLSITEFTTAFPDATADAFAAVDSDGDNAVSEAEYVASVEAGILPAE